MVLLFLTDFPASQTSNQCFSSLGSDDEPVTQSHCNCISPLVGGRWKKLLRNLGVAEVPTIENVDKDYQNETVGEKCYQGLRKWMESCGPQTATTRKLCDALRQTGCTEALEALSKAGICQITVNGLLFILVNFSIASDSVIMTSWVSWLVERFLGECDISCRQLTCTFSQLQVSTVFYFGRFLTGSFVFNFLKVSAAFLLSPS